MPIVHPEFLSGFICCLVTLLNTVLNRSVIIGDYFGKNVCHGKGHGTGYSIMYHVYGGHCWLATVQPVIKYYRCILLHDIPYWLLVAANATLPAARTPVTTVKLVGGKMH